MTKGISSTMVNSIAPSTLIHTFRTDEITTPPTLHLQSPPGGTSDMSGSDGNILHYRYVAVTSIRVLTIPVYR